MYRINDNPPDKWPEIPIASPGDPWWIAKIRPRMEKLFAVDCKDGGFPYYLPFVLRITRRRDNNKPRKSIVPLFPGYATFRCAKGRQYDIWETGRIVRIVEVRNQQRLMKELEQIEIVLANGIRLEPLQDYTIGTPVRVRTGPLRGIEGIVQKSLKQMKLILSVEGIGQAVCKVDAGDVEPVAKSAPAVG